MRTFVIAEAGISHDGDIAKAMKLIDVAREAKADAVKFQTFNALKLSERRKNPALAAILKPYEMPLTWLPQLKSHCDDAGIEFMTTCFDEETIPIVAPFVKRFKVAASESRSEKFIEAHLNYGREVIISTNGGFNPYPVKYLHCVSKYPTPVNEAMLCDIYINGCDGFSDHTRYIPMGSWAVAAGAQIVEAHFCDWETNWDNPDRCVSHDPSSLIRYVEMIREVELALYGAEKAESKTEVPPGSAPHISRPPSSAASDLSDARPVSERGFPLRVPPPQEQMNSQQGGPLA